MFITGVADAYDYSHIDRLAEEKSQSLWAFGMECRRPSESVIKLVGYENLCYMLYDDEALLSDIF